jgi:hypothetical protein
MNVSPSMLTLSGLDNIFEWKKCFEEEKLSDNYERILSEFLISNGVEEREVVIKMINASMKTLLKIQEPLYISFMKLFIILTIKNYLENR